MECLAYSHSPNRTCRSGSITWKRALECASSHASSVLNCLCVDESTKCDLFCARSLHCASMEMPRFAPSTFSSTTTHRPATD